MKTVWDYTTLADAYLKRPEYAGAAIDALLKWTKAGAGPWVCDVGAGTAHLTRELATRHCRVEAVEPNDAMRAHGIERTREFPQVSWYEGTGENTGRADARFDLVTFGSSFNVTDRPRALRESARILKPGGWFACLWNHRDLDDPIQAHIEALIGAQVPGYRYGTRREDQHEVIEQSRLFGPVRSIAEGVVHRQSVADCVEAWRSHGTLQRQAGSRFSAVVEAIESYLRSLGRDLIDVPYTTRLWAAPLRD